MACILNYDITTSCVNWFDHLPKINQRLEEMGIPIKLVNHISNKNACMCETKSPILNGWSIGDIIPCDWEQTHKRLLSQAIASGAESAMFATEDFDLIYVDPNNYFRISPGVHYEIVGGLKPYMGVSILDAVAYEELSAGDFVYIKEGKALKS